MTHTVASQAAKSNQYKSLTNFCTGWQKSQLTITPTMEPTNMSDTSEHLAELQAERRKTAQGRFYLFEPKIDNPRSAFNYLVCDRESKPTALGKFRYRRDAVLFLLVVRERYVEVGTNTEPLTVEQQNKLVRAMQESNFNGRGV